jgi:hypothetical protein
MGNERSAEEHNTLGQARLPGTLGMQVDREQQRPRFYATGEPSSDPAARIIERWAANHVFGSAPSNFLYPGAYPYLVLGDRPGAPMTRLANRCYGNPLPDINGLAVHCTGGSGSGTPYALANYGCVNGWNQRQASAHFAIAGDGTVIQFIPTNFSAFAQGSPANEHWLSVEIDNPGKDPPNGVKAGDAQIKAARELFAWVCRTFSIRPQIAAGHLCAEKLRTPAAKAYDDVTRQVCAYGSLSTQFSTDEKVAQNSRGLSCHRWLQPYVKSCPGYGLLGQLTDIADGATKLVGG